jgi:CBS domain-containing protein
VRVSDVMTSDVVSVEPSTPLHEVARLLIERGISGVPVVDGERLVGVVSDGDFIKKQAHIVDEPDEPVHGLLPFRSNSRATSDAARATTAAEAMSAPPIVIEPTASLTAAARSMEQHRVNRLPVVDGDRLVGIVTRADIVRSYVRDDAQIAADIETALRAVEGVSVSVEAGVATLVGSVRSPGLAESVFRITASVPGVVAVDARELNAHDSEERWYAQLSKSERDLLLTRE